MAFDAIASIQTNKKPVGAGLAIILKRRDKTNIKTRPIALIQNDKNNLKHFSRGEGGF
jgi:hypothetical protein